HGGGDDLGELAHIAVAVAAQQLQAFPLRGQSGPATVGGDDQRRNRDRVVVVAVVVALGIDERGRGFRDVGGVLAGGDEHRRDPVGRVGAVVVHAGHEAAEVGDLAGSEYELGRGVHDLAKQRVRNRRLGHHALAAGAQHVDLGALLVGGEV